MKEAIDLIKNDRLILGFGRLLLQQRNVNNKTRRDLAVRLGISEYALPSWENGESLPGEEKLPKIAEVYGIDLNTVREKYEISKKAKEVLRTERKFKPVRGKIPEDMFSGQIVGTREIKRTTPQIFFPRRK